MGAQLGQSPVPAYAASQTWFSILAASAALSCGRNRPYPKGSDLMNALGLGE
ncbi:hypothetical protein AM571_PC02098 (plasmid) [Rhizobium etli 8C-3]|uniref:Uncharacterized protein n=1 Tax=Rhizobium etli 8C-3 TaxID=538025 RepID=A0A1L5PI02_RHIET|nr:hypothetical protein AM571_PC02098 [Rhizobium etli 8C-3]